MTAFSRTGAFVATPSPLARAANVRTRPARSDASLDAEGREMLSILGRTFFILGLGAAMVISFTGQLPLFFLPLGLFLLFGSALQWRNARPRTEARERPGLGAEKPLRARENERRMRFTDTA